MIHVVTTEGERKVIAGPHAGSGHEMDWNASKIALTSSATHQPAAPLSSGGDAHSSGCDAGKCSSSSQAQSGTADQHSGDY